MTYVWASPQSTYVPSHEASDNLTIAFLRDPAKFPINRYAQRVLSNKMTGYYLYLNTDNAARVLNYDANSWADGEDLPAGFTEQFEWRTFSTERYAFPFRIGNLAMEQASWDILAAHAGINLQKGLTQQTAKVCAAMQTSGNWTGATGTASATGGGVWLNSSETNAYIRKTFNQVTKNIIQNTNGMVGPSDIVCVVNPDVATTMSQAPEIRDYIKQSPVAAAAIEYQGNYNAGYGLPDQLFGIKLVIEDTPKITSIEGAASTTRTWALSDDVAVFCARPGGLTAPVGGPSFSTLQLFEYGGVKVESINDPINKRTIGNCEINYDFKVAAPLSGYLVTDCIS